MILYCKITEIKTQCLHTKVCIYIRQEDLHTKVCMKIDANRVILPQTIKNMEQSRGLSTVLRQRITDTKVAIIGHMAVELIAEAIKRLGFVDIVLASEYPEQPLCDVVICTCTEKNDCKAVIAYYRQIDIPVICAFNFGIGACAVIIPPEKRLPHFVEDKAGNDTVRSMIDYTSGYSKFWNIQNNEWIDDARKWIASPEIKSSIGEYTMTAMVAHLLVAMIAGNKVKTYPKFYLSTIANDVN